MDVQKTYSLKDILLHLSKHNDRYWTPQELKETLQLDLPATKIRHKLMAMVKGDLIEWGETNETI